jgi:hypothetical protein
MKTYVRKVCFKLSLMTLGALLLVESMPSPASALDRDVKAILVAGEYGILGGTVIGAATLPFSQNLRSVFIGSSVGLYLGLAVGIYYVMERDSPHNPLRRQSPQAPHNSYYDQGSYTPLITPWREAQGVSSLAALESARLSFNDVQSGTPFQLKFTVFQF